MFSIIPPRGPQQIRHKLLIIGWAKLGIQGSHVNPKFGQSLVPHIGIGGIRARVEANRYAQLTLINDPSAMDQALQKGLRDMVKQSR